MFDTVSALFNMIKGSLNSLINGESQILGRQGKNKDLSSGTGARTRALDRGTAFPGRGGWEDHSRGRWGGGGGCPGGHSGEGDSAGPCPHHPSRRRACSGTAGAEVGRPGEGLVSANGAPGTPLPLSAGRSGRPAAKQLRGPRHDSTVVS